MGSSDAPFLSEEEEMAKRLCGQVLGEKWINGPIKCEIMGGGYINKLLLCTLDEEEVASKSTTANNGGKVLVRFMSGKLRFRTLTDASEALVYYIFARNKLGPRLLGVFSKIRLEEYIPSRTLTLIDFNNSELYAALARKLAKIHSLSAPIGKDPSVVIELYKSIVAEIDINKLSLDKLEKNERLMAEEIFSMDFKAEVEWIQKMIPKIVSRVVFCHNDFHNNNILIRTDHKTGSSFDERLLVVDMEMCGYFYRGLDFGSHFIAAQYAFTGSGEPAYIGPFPEERRRFFIREYLKEWEKLSPLTFDPLIDTIDNILLEADLFGLLRGMIIYSLTFDSIVGDELSTISSLSRFMLLKSSLQRMDDISKFKKRWPQMTSFVQRSVSAHW